MLLNIGSEDNNRVLDFNEVFQGWSLKVSIVWVWWINLEGVQPNGSTSLWSGCFVCILAIVEFALTMSCLFVWTTEPDFCTQGQIATIGCLTVTFPFSPSPMLHQCTADSQPSFCKRTRPWNLIRTYFAQCLLIRFSYFLSHFNSLLSEY